MLPKDATDVWHKLNIPRDDEFGNDVEGAPLFRVFRGERINNRHSTRAEKIQARVVLARNTVAGGTDPC